MLTGEMSAIMADELFRKKIVQVSPNRHTASHPARKSPQFVLAMKDRCGGIWLMYKPSKGARWSAAIAVLALLAAASAWIGYGS